MGPGPLTVVLRSTGLSGSAVDGIADALREHGEVVVPELEVPEHAVILEEPALAVLAAISASGADSAAVCGIGLGAMVAMKIAVGFPRRVTHLVLSTARTPESTAVLSLAHGVRGLLPAATAQRLGASPRQTLDLLDQVRPLDYRSWSGRITTPTLVLVGDRDVANLGPSMRLVETLPHVRLQTVPRLGPGWISAHPDRYATLVAAFLAETA